MTKREEVIAAFWRAMDETYEAEHVWAAIDGEPFVDDEEEP